MARKVQKTKNKISSVMPYIFSILVVINIIIYLLFTSEALRYVKTKLGQPDADQYVDNWNSVDEHIFVYSAFWEYRLQQPQVKIIGIGLLKKFDISHLRCLLRYNGTVIISKSLSYINMYEHHLKRHTAIFFSCKANRKPSYVALLKLGNIKMHWLKVHLIQPPDDDNSWMNNTVVCVRPFFGTFPNNNLQIAEFVAYYTILGVNKFVFYDYQTEYSLRRLINLLSDNGIRLSFHPWDLPKRIADTWSFGQMAAIADCMYRQASSHQYVIIIDVDEFIVPHKLITLQEILQEIINKRCQKCSTFVFRQTFFCIECPDDPKNAKVTIPLLTLKKTRRENFIWKPYIRSKSIVRPIGIESPGIHFTIHSIKTWRPFIVSPEIAKLHHYRLNKCRNINNTVIDRSIFKYKQLLLESDILKLWKSIEWVR